MENIENLKTQAIHLDEQLNILKDKIADVLKDKSISLTQRWDFFAELPDYLGNHESWIQHFDSLGDISWYDDFGKDRYALVRMKDVVESMEDDIEYREEQGYPQYDIAALKEEILERNIVSFVFDW